MSFTCGGRIKKLGLLVTSACLWLLLFQFVLAEIKTSTDHVASSSDLPKVVAIRVDGEIFSETLDAINDDIGEELIIYEKVLNQNSSVKDIADFIHAVSPKAIILLGNSPVSLYKKYQQNHPDKNFPPSITISAIHVDRLITGIKNIIGIRYEVPAITSMVHMRMLSEKPIRRVGVIYRAWLDEQIEINRELCKLEEFELVTVRLPNRVSFQKFSYHLRHLLDRDDIDALWVVNDNALLSPRVIQNGWLPAIRHFDKPVVVGTEELTREDLKFGTFTVIPDHYALGIQAAQIVADIMENNWQIEKEQIYHPISINKILNLKLAKSKKMKIDESILGTVDVVLY